MTAVWVLAAVTAWLLAVAAILLVLRGGHRS